MSNSYSGNLRGWYERSDVDWFAQFIQAWIPFNAWYRHSYPSIRNERDILDEIKKPGNLIYNGIIPLFRSNNSEAIDFRNHISQLHRRLSNQIIENKGKKCTFEEIDFGENPKKTSSMTSYKITYKAEYLKSNTHKVQLEIINSSNKRLTFIELNTWSEQEFNNHHEINKISRDRVSKLKNCFHEIRPRIIESLLIVEATEGLEFGSYKFRDDDSKIFSGIIEIIYTLRNQLFHGEITPNQQHNTIYEPAYHIIRTMLRCVI